MVSYFLLELLDLLKFLIKNFNMPWFLFICVLMFRKQLVLIISDIREVKIGNTTIKTAKSFHENLEESYEKTKQEFNKKYKQNLEEPPHLGGNGTFENLLIVFDVKKLAHYYKKHGTFETIELLFNEYERSNVIYYDNELYEEALKENKNSIEYIAYKHILKFYYLTVEMENPNEIWRFEDIVKYQKMIRIIITSHNISV